VCAKATQLARGVHGELAATACAAFVLAGHQIGYLVNSMQPAADVVYIQALLVIERKFTGV
jgi:hypothetical protein